MANKYCTCGAITPYSSAEPKFCCGCGKSFGFAPVKSTPSSQASTPLFFHNSNEEQVSLIPKIDKLEIIVKPSRNFRPETIGKIWGTEAIDTGRINKQVKAKKISNKKIIEDFKIEATPSGRDNPIEITG